MWDAMGTHQVGRIAFGGHRLRNGLAVAAMVLTPSVLLILLGLSRPAGRGPRKSGVFRSVNG